MPNLNPGQCGATPNKQCSSAGNGLEKTHPLTSLYPAHCVGIRRAERGTPPLVRIDGRRGDNVSAPWLISTLPEFVSLSFVKN